MPVPSQLSQPEVLEGGTFRLLLQGDSGQAYSVEVSSDLKAWETLTTVICTNGSVQFRDDTSATNSIRFYRVRLAP